MEIAPGVFDLTAPSRGYLKGGYVHAFLIVYNQELILIDTLFDPDAQVILDQIRALGKQVQDLKHIVLTHAHRAHLGGLKRLKELSGAAIYSHAWEVDIVSADRQQQGVSVRPHLNSLPVFPIVFIGSLVAPWSQHQPCVVDQLIGDGDQIGPLRVVATPGHTPGHLAFYLPAPRTLFTGDAFVTWPLLCPGWQNAALNVKETWESLNRLAALDVQAVGVGHGAPVLQDGAQVMRELAARGKY